MKSFTEQQRDVGALWDPTVPQLTARLIREWVSTKKLSVDWKCVSPMRFLEAKRYQSARVSKRKDFLLCAASVCDVEPCQAGSAPATIATATGCDPETDRSSTSAALPGGSLARCGLRRIEPLRFQAGAKLAKEKGGEDSTLAQCSQTTDEHPGG